MIGTNQYTITHDLYYQFGQWMGVEPSKSSNYFAINNSLFAAQRYIEENYNLLMGLSSKTEPILSSTKIRTQFPINNIKTLFSDGEIVFPTVRYFNPESLLYEEETGDYEGTDLLSNADYVCKYLTGYVYKDTSDYLGVNFDNDYRVPPITIFFPNNLPVISPQRIKSNQEIIIKGTPGFNLYINNEIVGPIPENGSFPYTVDSSKGISTLTFKLEDPEDVRMTSDDLKILFVPDDTEQKPEFVVIGYTKVTNEKQLKVTFYSSLGCDIYLDGDVVLESASSNINEIVINFETELDIYTFYGRLYSKLGSVESDMEDIFVLYDESYLDQYIEQVNKDAHNIPFMPESLLIAFFKLAKHFYQGTLYGNSNVEQYRASNESSVTYMSHTIPKDIKALLAPFYHVGK